MGSNEIPSPGAAMAEPADSGSQAANYQDMISRKKEKDDILKRLKEDGVKTVVLEGETGVGKTFIAKQIGLAVGQELAFMTWWVYLNQQDESQSPHLRRSLIENIAHQMSVLATDREDKEQKEEQKEELKEELKEEQKQEQEKKRLERLRRKISDELKEKRAKLLQAAELKAAKLKAAELKAKEAEKRKVNRAGESTKPTASDSVELPAEKKFLLLILDGVPDTMNEDEVTSILEELTEEIPYKVLRTRRKKHDKDEEMNGVPETGNIPVIEVQKLEDKYALFLLKQEVTEEVRKDACFEKFAHQIAEKSDGLPAVIVMVAEALNRFGEHDSRTPTWEDALEEAAQREDALEEAAQREKGPDEVNPLLLSVSNMLQRSDNKALVNCWWHSLQVFGRGNGVNYDQLIVCWILEGCISNIGGVEEAYKEGYRVFMELIDRHILKMQGYNIVVMEDLALKVPDYRRDGYGGTSNLGLAHAYDHGEWQVFGGITQAGCMIRTPCDVKTWDKVSTLLTDGCPLPGEVLNLFPFLREENPNPREVRYSFSDQLKGLRVLVLFNPTVKSLSLAFSQMEKLRLLVLRGCDKLKNIDVIGELKSLEVLEISGATSLKKMDDKFFEKLTELRSLHLSGVQIESLPSVSQLKKLRLLILRGCSCLTRMPRLSDLKDLEVIDLSGASQLGRFENKALLLLKKLEMLKVTKTKLERVPILADLGELRRLALEGCESLPRSSKLGALTSLQILGLSNSGYLEEIPDESRSEKRSLRILDLSKTTISILPFNFKGFIALEQLDLSSTKIVKLPSLSELKNLEVLNLSHCRDLEEIGADSFGEMPRLRCLNLSETKIKSLESLFNLVNLRQLLLKNCSSLEGPQSQESLSNLQSLSKLEELDLSGVTLLEGTTAGYLNGMTGLRRLDLSKTGIGLPFPQQLTNLTELSLRGCSLPETEPNLGACTKLEILDLSGTRVPSLPSSLKGLGRLRELKLRGCSELAELRHLESLTLLEVLDLFGTEIRQVPPGISYLTSLKHLDLPHFTNLQNFVWESIKPLPEELNWVESGIYEYSERRPCMLLTREELSQILVRHPKLEDGCFNNFHFFVCPRKGQRIAGDFYFHRVDPSSRRLYFSTSPDENGRVLEIVGSEILGAEIEGAFRKAEHISFMDNKLIKSFSDVTAGLTERREAGSAERGEGLAMKRCILEMCAEMKTIFGKEETEDAEKKTTGGRERKEAAEKKTTADGEETKVIMVENLETLWASNLLKLNCVFHENAQSQSFNRLTELYLDCCPVLEVVFVSSELPQRLKTLQIKFCDNLKRLFSEKMAEPKLLELEKLHLLELPELTSIGVGDSRSVVDIFPSVRSFRLSECPKLSLKEIGSPAELRDLYLERCPVLEAVFASSPLPENLEFLEIRFCNKLKTLFPPDMQGQLQNLQKLHLVELPELASIGNSQNIGDKFPSVQSIKVTECGKLSLKQIGSTKVLTDLYLERCPLLEAVFASSPLPENLKILEIRFCNKLKTLFPPDMQGELQKLEKLHLVKLPELAGIGNSQNIGDKFPSVQSIKVTECGKLSLKQIGSTKVLTDLYLERCPVLEAVFASPPLPENLEILEIKFCNKLMKLFPPSMGRQLKELRKLLLVELPELASIGNSQNIGDKFPSVQSIRVTECRKLGLNEIGSPIDLRDLYLERCSVLEAVFTSSQLPENLEIVEIRFCHELKTLFPSIRAVIPKLENLHLVELPQLTGIGVEVPEERKVKDVFPSMQSIKVRKCPKLNELERFRRLSYASVEDF